MSSEYTGGLQVIFDNMERQYSQLDSEIDAAVQGAGIECQALTKQNAPVGTPESTGRKGYKGGRLRASYQYVRKGPRACIVRTNVKYAPPVELGHHTRSGSFVPARPHFFPSFETASRHLLDELKSIGVGR